VERRNEVLAFLAGGLRDLSVSRSRSRARGWGIEVPDDPDQVIYVWWDALGNYLSALDYGDGPGGAAYERWWSGARRRVHLAGKGVVRFHAVYWPAMLLSAGEPPPTDILVHDYLTVDGHKISKSSGVTVDPAGLAAAYGTDAVRWWLLREVPRVGDADFTLARLAGRANDELANGLGNLVNRVVAMIHRYRDGHVPAADGAGVPEPLDAVAEAIHRAPYEIDAGLADVDYRRATSGVWNVVDTANRAVNLLRPWDLAKAERAGDRHAGTRLDATLAGLIGACRAIPELLAPFLPDAAAGIARQTAATHLGDGDGEGGAGEENKRKEREGGRDGAGEDNGRRLPAPVPLFRRITVPE
jgi:methionyl-tRNA synthetase